MLRQLLLKKRALQNNDINPTSDSIAKVRFQLSNAFNQTNYHFHDPESLIRPLRLFLRDNLIAEARGFIENATDQNLAKPIADVCLEQIHTELVIALLRNPHLKHYVTSNQLRDLGEQYKYVCPAVLLLIAQDENLRRSLGAYRIINWIKYSAPLDLYLASNLQIALSTDPKKFDSYYKYAQHKPDLDPILNFLDDEKLLGWAKGSLIIAHYILSHYDVAKTYTAEELINLLLIHPKLISTGFKACAKLLLPEALEHSFLVKYIIYDFTLMRMLSPEQVARMMNQHLAYSIMAMKQILYMFEDKLLYDLHLEWLLATSQALMKESSETRLIVLHHPHIIMKCLELQVQAVNLGDLIHELTRNSGLAKEYLSKPKSLTALGLDSTQACFKFKLLPQDYCELGVHFFRESEENQHLGCAYLAKGLENQELDFHIIHQILDTFSDYLIIMLNSSVDNTIKLKIKLQILEVAKYNTASSVQILQNPTLMTALGLDIKKPYFEFPLDGDTYFEVARHHGLKMDPPNNDIAEGYLVKAFGMGLQKAALGVCGIYYKTDSEKTLVWLEKARGCMGTEEMMDSCKHLYDHYCATKQHDVASKVHEYYLEAKAAMPKKFTIIAGEFNLDGSDYPADCEDWLVDLEEYESPFAGSSVESLTQYLEEIRLQDNEEQQSLPAQSTAQKPISNEYTVQYGLAEGDLSKDQEVTQDPENKTKKGMPRRD